MPGSKTRFGFSGADEPLPVEGREPDSRPAARTLLGHENHRPGEAIAPLPRIEIQGGGSTVESRSGVPETVFQEEITERVDNRRHTGKSKFPAIARLFGRWTTGGGFSRNRMSEFNAAIPGLSRRIWLSRLAIFLGAALLSFLIALVVMKVGHLE